MSRMMVRSSREARMRSWRFRKCECLSLDRSRPSQVRADLAWA